MAWPGVAGTVVGVFLPCRSLVRSGGRISWHCVCPVSRDKVVLESSLKQNPGRLNDLCPRNRGMVCCQNTTTTHDRPVMRIIERLWPKNTLGVIPDSGSLGAASNRFLVVEIVCHQVFAAKQDDQKPKQDRKYLNSQTSLAHRFLQFTRISHH